MSQIICPISGEILSQSNLLLGFNLEQSHPIFQAHKKILLSPDIIWKFQAAKSLREKNLYYLAVLNTTALIEFRVAANPMPYIVDSTFLDICHLASWIDYAKHQIRDQVSFPQYVVDKDNKELKNISIWINAIRDIQSLFLNKSKYEDLKRELTNSAQRIEKEFRNAGLIGRAFTPTLARLALDLAGVKAEYLDSWKTLLNTPLEEAWMLGDKDKEELDYIQEILQAELPVNHDQSLAVLRQIQLLINKSTEGLTTYTFVEADEFKTKSDEELMSDLIAKEERDEFPLLSFVSKAEAKKLNLVSA